MRRVAADVDRKRVLDGRRLKLHLAERVVFAFEGRGLAGQERAQRGDRLVEKATAVHRRCQARTRELELLAVRADAHAGDDAAVA
jgi:hypothetical protein